MTVRMSSSAIASEKSDFLLNSSSGYGNSVAASLLIENFVNSIAIGKGLWYNEWKQFHKAHIR